MKLLLYMAAAAAIVALAFGAVHYLESDPGGLRSGVLNVAAWERMASPGALSRPHAFLENNCAACHTPGQGVEAAACIACHANSASLLQRQPTAFHANVGSCRECHREHQGVDRPSTRMDHRALAEIGFRQLNADAGPDSENKAARKSLLDWIGEHKAAAHSPSVQSSFSPEEAVLNCAVCHGTKDRHAKLFGQDCGQCHTTAKWTIPEFLHPSATSKDCVQCHQAPPSHYMMHFSMISAKVAGKPSAKVDQCYECHQTTSWNDIKGVGYYKHH